METASRLSPFIIPGECFAAGFSVAVTQRGPLISAFVEVTKFRELIGNGAQRTLMPLWGSAAQALGSSDHIRIERLAGQPCGSRLDPNGRPLDQQAHRDFVTSFRDKKLRALAVPYV